MKRRQRLALRRSLVFMTAEDMRLWEEVRARIEKSIFRRWLFTPNARGIELPMPPGCLSLHGQDSEAMQAREFWADAFEREHGKRLSPATFVRIEAEDGKLFRELYNRGKYA